MKNIWILGLAALVFSACNNSGSEVKINIDSVGKKFDKAAEKTWDSTKKNLKNLKNKIKNKLEDKDSTDK